MQKPSNKIFYLDGIRGVAAFGVLIHHFLLGFYPAHYSFEDDQAHLGKWDVQYGRSIYSAFTNGNFFVCIFFVLSGFVLSRRYFQTHSSELLVSGAQRRFLRLYTPVAATIIMAAVMMVCGLFFNNPVMLITHSGWFATQWNFHDVWQQCCQCLLYKTMFLGDASFDTCMWTISIEFYGSLLVFAFLALTHNTRNRGTMLVLFIIFFYLISYAYLEAFALGISLNYIEARREKANKYLLLILPFLLLPAGLVLGSLPTGKPVIHTFFSQTPVFILETFDFAWIHTGGAYLVVTSFVISPRLQHFISMRLFRFLGYISFCLYLLHPIVIGSVTCFAFLHMYGHIGYIPSTVYAFLITLAVCIPLSWLMTKYIDEAGINFAKRVYTRYIKKTGSHTPEGA